MTTLPDFKTGLLALCLAFSLSAYADEVSEFDITEEPSRVETTFDDAGYLNQCEWFTQKKPYALCITTKIGGNNPDVLYYMHGASGNEKRWMNRYGEVRANWDRMGFDPPTTVTMSFGPVWLISEKNKLATSGIFDFIANQVMFKIEERLGGLKGRRLLIGESMGGFNVAQLIMKRREMFSRAVILCPAITPFGPFTKLKELKQFAKRTHAKKTLVFWSVVMQRVFFPDMDTWANASPLLFGDKALGPSTPPLLISCGRQDEWGFFEGAEKFASLAQTQGVDARWEPLDGTHCSFNSESVAEFLTH